MLQSFSGIRISGKSLRWSVQGFLCASQSGGHANDVVLRIM